MELKLLQSAFESQDKDAIQKALLSIENTSLSEEQIGALIIYLTTLYLDVSNSFNKEYVDGLSKALASLKKLKNIEIGLKDTQKIEDLKASM